VIKITYVGSLTTELELENEEIEWKEGLADVGDLIEDLCSNRGENWAKMLHLENLLISVNQSMVKTDQALSDGDEIMFFPPMHGG